MHAAKLLSNDGKACGLSGLFSAKSINFEGKSDHSNYMMGVLANVTLAIDPIVRLWLTLLLRSGKREVSPTSCLLSGIRRCNGYISSNEQCAGHQNPFCSKQFFEDDRQS